MWSVYFLSLEKTCYFSKARTRCHSVHIVLTSVHPVCDQCACIGSALYKYLATSSIRFEHLIMFDLSSYLKLRPMLKSFFLWLQQQTRWCVRQQLSNQNSCICTHISWFSHILPFMDSWFCFFSWPSLFAAQLDFVFQQHNIQKLGWYFILRQ